jgi:hypothetical protein
MADIRRKGTVVAVSGQPPKPAELMEIVRTDEKFNVYDLDDGTQLRMRTTVTEIWRVIDEYDPEGNPFYVVKAQGTLSVIAPEHLKRGAKGK